jgi:uncharacterized protein
MNIKINNIMPFHKIPTIEECYRIMQDRMPQHIIEHSEQVMRVAASITSDLKDSVNINKSLILAASLLHDITKNESIATHEKHDLTGGAYIRELGYNSVAEIIEEHVELKEYIPDSDLKEKEIVFYADKRVTHTKIVTVEERILDLLIRYGKTEEIRQHILKNKEMIMNIEKKINSFLKNDLNTVIFKLTGENK